MESGRLRPTLNPGIRAAPTDGGFGVRAANPQVEVFQATVLAASAYSPPSSNADEESYVEKRVALFGTPGKVSSANSPWSGRASLGRKAPFIRGLCRWNPPAFSPVRILNRQEYAHPSALDVSRSAAPEHRRYPPIARIGKFRQGSKADDPCLHKE
jgi:hypothetical protein